MNKEKNQTRDYVLRVSFSEDDYETICEEASRLYYSSVSEYVRRAILMPQDERLVEYAYCTTMADSFVRVRLSDAEVSRVKTLMEYYGFNNMTSYARFAVMVWVDNMERKS